MCGRYSFVPSKAQLEAELAEVDLPIPLEISFNIAPTQNAYVLTATTHLAVQLVAQRMKWGLLPSWMKDGKPSGKLINARAETVMEKPSFRAAFAERRCLVPADSFYEWRKEGKQRRPFRILDKNGGLLYFAGIWEQWGEGTDALLTFSVLTTTPNQEMVSVHDRMPVLLQQHEQRNVWLDEKSSTVQLQELLEPLPNDSLDLIEINPAVGNVRYDNADLHRPILRLF